MKAERKEEIWMDAPVLENLLADRTTGTNLVWQTEEKGLQKMDAAHAVRLQPRREKAGEQKSRRTREWAEVFTPAWLCREQNDLVDEHWAAGGENWRDYVDAPRLELACGEAPYLATGRDAVTGERIDPPDRVGLLDRKLRAVSQAVDTREEWLCWAVRAVQSIYGFEFQGDSLFLARKNLLCAVSDFFFHKFGCLPKAEELEPVAEVLSWNLWQMDAVTGCPPGRPECLCQIKNWRTHRQVTYSALVRGDTDFWALDAVVGNPPYQRKDGGNGASASPLYPLFVEQAQALGPRCASLIIPAKWYSGGKGLDRFRDRMLHDRHISHLVDYTNSLDCFPGVDIAGGACYFLWQRDWQGPCRFTNIRNGSVQRQLRMLDEFPTLIRYPAAVSILRKVLAAGQPSLSGRVSSRKPFGLATNVRPTQQGELCLRYNGGIGPFPREAVKKGQEMIGCWKVMISYLTAEHAGQPDKSGRFRVLSTMELLAPGTVCTETYLVAGSFAHKSEAVHFQNYLRTRFVRFLIGQIAVSQHITRQCFSFVPEQDFSRNWTDRALYQKYGLDAEEIAFIRSLIKPMGEEKGGT